MITTVTNNGPKDDAQTSATVFSVLNCVSPDQQTMIDQRIVSVLKGKDKVPGETGENGKTQKVTFSKPARDEVKPLIKKGATLEVGRFNSVHETIHERGKFVVNEVDPVLSKWKMSFRWFCEMVAAISQLQSRGSWNNHRTIFKAFGDGLKTDPDITTLPEGKLLICAKHDNPVEFVRCSRDLIHMSTLAELEEIVTGKKREKREPKADRYYKNLGVRAFWNEEKEDLRFEGMTPAVREVIYDVLDKLESEAQEMDNALSTLLDDGSFDWTGYWADTAKSSEITISYTTAEGQFTFWDPEKGQVPYGTWAEVVEAVRAESPDAYLIVADGTEHKIAETSFATAVPQTQVTIPKEQLDQWIRKQEAEEKPDSVEEPDQTGKAAETSEQAEAQDHTSSPEDETPEGDDQGAEGDSAPEDNLVERVEADGWTPGEGWTEERPGSFNLTQAFRGAWTGERYVRVRISCSGKMDDSEQVDILHEVGIPCDWDQVIGFLEGDPFAMHRRNAKLVVFTTEGGEPYLCATNGDKWKIWLNAPAISLSRR
ncbi:MAG: hypothetical protein ACLP5H_14480 [Desulfomonilaceae bacterium]